VVPLVVQLLAELTIDALSAIASDNLQWLV
jgi:hypothetical protein